MPTPRRRRKRRGVDLALAVLVALFLASLVESTVALSTPLTLLGMAAGLAQGAALYWRRSHPDRVMAITLAGGLVIGLLAPGGLFPYAGIIAIFTFASARPPQWSLPAVLGLVGITAIAFFDHPSEDVFFAMAFPVVAWALGEAARNRHAAIDEAARRAVGEEQARIARELHDVIAHSVSVIVVQAAAAGDVFDRQPEQARRALSSIEDAGREALGELRRLLAIVRPAGDDEPQRAPQPGLGRLGALAESLAAAGLKVTIHHDGEGGPALAAGIDLCAYRIVQEALTNTLRHAGATSAQVTVRRAADAVELEILDDGTSTGAATAATAAAAAAGPGRGIAGMRERAAMLGGSLEAGPRPEGGFRVHARLPLKERA